MHLPFSTRDAVFTVVIVALEVEEFGNSSDRNYKLDHMAYSNASSLHSHAFQFMVDITVKIYALHS